MWNMVSLSSSPLASATFLISSTPSVLVINLIALNSWKFYINKFSKIFYIYIYKKKKNDFEVYFSVKKNVDSMLGPRNYVTTGYVTVECGLHVRTSSPGSVKAALTSKLPDTSPEEEWRVDILCSLLEARQMVYYVGDENETDRIQISQTEVFTKCFENMQPVLEQGDKWLTRVNAYCKESFRNIRIRPRKIKPSAHPQHIQGRDLRKKQMKLKIVNKRKTPPFRKQEVQ